MRNLSTALAQLAWFTQLGASLVAPPLLCIGGAAYAISHWGWPAWCMLPAFFFGFGGAAAAFVTFCRQTQAGAQKRQKSAPPAFNNHK